MARLRRLRAATSTALIVFLVLAGVLAAGLYTTYLVVTWVKAGVVSAKAEARQEVDADLLPTMRVSVAGTADLVVSQLKATASRGKTTTSKVITTATAEPGGLWLRSSATADPSVVPIVGDMVIDATKHTITVTLAPCRVVVTGSTSKVPTAVAGTPICK